MIKIIYLFLQVWVQLRYIADPCLHVLLRLTIFDFQAKKDKVSISHKDNEKKEEKHIMEFV